METIILFGGNGGLGSKLIGPLNKKYKIRWRDLKK
jgi:hypothetical protein